MTTNSGSSWRAAIRAASRRSRVVTFAAAIALLAGAGTGAAWGAGAFTNAIPGTDGVIHGCFDDGSGRLRVIDPTRQRCGQDEAAMSWNQAGAPGAIGPSGPSGPTGPAGASSAVQVQRLSTTENDAVLLSPQQSKYVYSPACPTGWQAVGGGFASSAGQATVRAFGTTISTYYVDLTNPTSDNVVVLVQVVCIK